MVYFNNQYDGLFKEPIIKLLKFKMVDMRHLEDCEIAISQRKIIQF